MTGYEGIEDIYEGLDRLKKAQLAVPLEYDYERISPSEVIFTASQDNRDGEPHIVHAVYNDLEEFTAWVGDLEAMTVDEQAEEIVIRRDAYNEIVEAGYGSYIRGLNVVEARR